MHLDTFIPAALLILLATSLSVVLFKYLGLGSVLGLLVAGIVIGPHSPGPRITDDIEDIRHFAELGVVLLLFLIGLEMRPSRLWSMRRAVFGLGSLQIAATGVAVGMSIDVGAIAQSPLLFVQHTAVLIALKLVILVGLVLAFGFSRTVAVRVVFYLAQGGEFGFVLFGSAQVLGVIDQDTFILAVGIISVTMLLTPFMVRTGEALSHRSADHNAAERALAHIRTSFPAVPVIARARDLAMTSKLIAAGATDAVPDVIESSLRLASLALQKANVSSDNVDLLVQGVRDRGYELAVEDPVPRSSGDKHPSPR